MSDIEEDIKILEKFNPGDEYTEKIKIAIENILAERKQDKARIKELEEALLKVKDKNTTLFITCRNSIPKQKVKELIESETINISGFDCIAVEDIEELLEESK